MEDLILSSIKDAVLFVNNFNQLLTLKYKLEAHPFEYIGKSVPREGSLNIKDESYKYRFHGGGCSLEKGTMKLEYSIVSLYTTNESIKINPGNFMEFMKSYKKEESIQDSQLKNFFEIFEQLEKKGIVKKLSESIAMYEIGGR